MEGYCQQADCNGVQEQWSMDRFEKGEVHKFELKAIVWIKALCYDTLLPVTVIQFRGFYFCNIQIKWNKITNKKYGYNGKNENDWLGVHVIKKQVPVITAI